MLYEFLQLVSTRLSHLLGFNSAQIPVKLIREILKFKKQPVVIDVGCNLGEFTQLVLKINMNSRIYAFDINKNLEKLYLNKFANYNVHYSRIGLTNFNGYAYLNAAKIGDRKASLSELGQIKNKLRVMKLDSALENFNFEKIQILKIDTEGNDLKVLEGAYKTLLLTEIVIFEIMFRTLINGDIPEDYVAYLKKRGFKYFYRCTKYFGLVEFKSLKPWEIMTQNIVCSRARLD